MRKGSVATQQMIRVGRKIYQDAERLDVMNGRFSGSRVAKCRLYRKKKKLLKIFM